MALLLIDPKFCITHKTNPKKVDGYYQALLKGASFPYIEVLQVGSYFVVRDGNHRAMAHLQAGERVWAQVFQESEYQSNLWLLGKRLAQAKRMNYNKLNEKTSCS
jgi:hypothetical protein